MLDAISISGLNCLKIVNETTAVALAYGNLLLVSQQLKRLILYVVKIILRNNIAEVINISLISYALFVSHRLLRKKLNRWKNYWLL